MKNAFGGFKSKREFDEWVAGWGDAEAATRAAKRVSMDYQRKIEEWVKNRASESGKTPSQVVDEFCKAFTAKGGKWKAARPLLTGKSQEFIDLILKIEEDEKGGPDIVSYELLGEKVTGDRAEVTVSSVQKKKDGADKKQEEKFLLRRVNGAWRIHGIGSATGDATDFEDEKMLAELKEAVRMMEEMKKKE